MSSRSDRNRPAKPDTISQFVRLPFGKLPVGKLELPTITLDEPTQEVLSGTIPRQEP